MELCYRGISHPYLSSTVETVETGITAQFLGQHYRVRRPVYQPCQDKLNLVYRGIAYRTDSEHSTDGELPQAGKFVAKLTEQLGI